MSKDLIKSLKQLRAELAFGADGEGAALVGEAIDAITQTVQRCADAVVMCPECECTTKSRKAILAMANSSGVRKSE